jgi:hypothetical protein
MNNDQLNQNIEDVQRQMGVPKSQYDSQQSKLYTLMEESENLKDLIGKLKHDNMHKDTIIAKLKDEL